MISANLERATHGLYFKIDNIYGSIYKHRSKTLQDRARSQKNAGKQRQIAYNEVENKKKQEYKETAPIIR